MNQTTLDGKEEAPNLTSKAEMALRVRYSRPEWCAFFEVPGDTGHRADCIAINMFPSRGHKVIGFEIKASRTDWLKELNNGHKADFFVGQCDEWYVVEASPGIVKKLEVPKGWGLLSLRKSRLYKTVPSGKTRTEPISRYFYTKMIEKSHYQNVSERVLREAEDRGFERGKNSAIEHRFNLKRIKENSEIVKNLRENGIFLWEYSKEEMERLKLALELIDILKTKSYDGIEYCLQDIRREQEDLTKALDRCDEILDKFRSSGKKGEADQK